MASWRPDVLDSRATGENAKATLTTSDAAKDGSTSQVTQRRGRPSSRLGIRRPALTRASRARPDTVTASYLGYPIVVGERELTIHDRDGRRLFAGRMEISTARAFIRGHRREARNQTEVNR